MPHDQADKKKTYAILLLFGGLGYIYIVLLLNFIVNPFEIFNTNFFKYNGAVQERYSKIEHLKTHTDFEVFLLGSSRVGTIDPIEASQILKKGVYNFYVSSGNQYDNLTHTKWLINHYKNLKSIYIQIDWPESYGPFKKNVLQYRHHPDISNNNYINFIGDFLTDTSFAAFKFKFINNFIQPGYYFYNRNIGNYAYPSRDHALLTDCQGYVDTVPDYRIAVPESARSVRQLGLNRDSLVALSEIVEISAKNNIELKLFITPHHYKYLNSINLEEYTQFLFELSQITSFWTFAMYSDITGDNCNYYESSHYRPIVTNEIFNRLIVNSSDENVRYITASNAAQQIRSIQDNFLMHRNILAN